MKRIICVLAAFMLALLILPASAEETEPEFADPVVTESEETAVPEAAEEPAAEEPAAEEPAAEPAEEPAPETPAEEPAEEPAPVEEPAEEPAAEPAGEPSEEPAGEPTPETPAEEPAAEETAEEAPVCTHEHTKDVYYFDSPDYLPIDDACHSVSGRALVEVVCQDCGEVLSSGVYDSAVEICPHVFRKGKCALCGLEGQAPEPPKAAEALPAPREESVLTLIPLDGNPNQYACTLTGMDLEQAGDTLVLRPEGRDTAIVLKTATLREELEVNGGTLTAEIVNPGERNVNASVRMYGADGSEATPGEEQVSLRIYGNGGGLTLTVTYTDPDGETGITEAGWDAEGGYWDVPWKGDGMYKY